MKITAKQALVMFDILKWSTSVHGELAGYTRELRNEIVNTIINQQSDKVIDLSEADRNGDE